MSSTFCILGVAVLWVAALPSPTLHGEVSGDQTPPNPLFHPSSATKQLRCNYPGQRSSDRKQRGGWSHVATLICIAPLKHLLFSYRTAHVFTLEKKLISKLRGWWVNGID